jgi:hypothetical protein
MIKFDPNISQATTNNLQQTLKPQGGTEKSGDFSGTVKALEKYLSNVDKSQGGYCIRCGGGGKGGHEFQSARRREKQTR